jgi:hypothetical protein
MYMEGMLSLALHRFDDKTTPAAMIKSFSENARCDSEEMGMYWKTDRGYYWYQAPIETQALMIEVYDEVAKDVKAVEDIKSMAAETKANAGLENYQSHYRSLLCFITQRY